MRRQLSIVISLAILGLASHGSVAQETLAPEDLLAPKTQEGTTNRSYAGGEPNRLTDDVQRDLVAAALVRIEASDIAGASQIFESQIAAIASEKGPDSLAVADAITAFAVQLYKAGHLTESLPYFRATVGAYRRARGADHPDVAVAEQDYSEMLTEASPESPPAEAVLVLEDAYRIRAKALGMDDAETGVNLSLLGRLKGHPALTKGDPARIEEAADLLRRAIEHLPKARNKMAWDLPDARFRLAELYARNDRVPQALAAFDAFLKARPTSPEAAAEKIADILIDHGHEAAARSVTELRPQSAL